MRETRENKAKDKGPKLQKEERKESDCELMSLLQAFGQCLALSLQYENHKAIRCLKSLPEHHMRTGWCLTKIGEAYMEL